MDEIIRYDHSKESCRAEYFSEALFVMLFKVARIFHPVFHFLNEAQVWPLQLRASQQCRLFFSVMQNEN